MILFLRKNADKAKKDVSKFLKRNPTFFELASLYYTTIEWYNDKPNEYNEEVIRLLKQHIHETGISIENLNP